MINIKQQCANCPKFLEKKAMLIQNSESIFDAVSDLEYFQEECSLTCNKIKEISDKTKDNYA